MANEGQQQAPHPDKLDADAVCAQCGTVNPEGVFICKNCGNNLRDQRAARMVADRQLLGEGEPRQRGKIVLGIIAFVGLIVLVIVGLQPDKFASWMVSLTNPTPSVAESFWRGPESATYDALAKTLEARPLTQEDISAAMSGGAAVDGYDGRYALVRNNEAIGAALAQTQGNWVYFVARLNNGDAIRGRGRFRDSMFEADWTSVGIRYDGDYFSAAGYGNLVAPGQLQGYGRVEFTEGVFEFLVLRAPS